MEGPADWASRRAEDRPYRQVDFYSEKLYRKVKFHQINLNIIKTSLHPDNSMKLMFFMILAVFG